jgi:hypothetical protein
MTNRSNSKALTDTQLRFAITLAKGYRLPMLSNLAKLKELKKGLMDDLLSGEVRVKI